jgi:hypothetical protein
MGDRRHCNIEPSCSSNSGCNCGCLVCSGHTIGGDVWFWRGRAEAAEARALAAEARATRLIEDAEKLRFEAEAENAELRAHLTIATEWLEDIERADTNEKDPAMKGVAGWMARTALDKLAALSETNTRPEDGAKRERAEP